MKMYGDLVSFMEEYNYGIECGGICAYCGGKARIFDNIADLIYGCEVNTLLELSAGSAIISLNVELGAESESESKSAHKVINDVNPKLATVYKALSIPDMCNNVLTRLENTDYNSETFYKAKQYWKNNNKTLSDFNGQDLCDAAYYAWILFTFSRCGNKISENFINTVEQMGDFYVFKNNLANYYGRLYGAEVYNESLFTILENLLRHPEKISNNTVIYIDPPYLPSKYRGVDSDVYPDSNFGKEEHKKLLELAVQLPSEKCKVIISGYDDIYNVYDDALKRTEFKNWSKIFVKELAIMFGNAGNLKDGIRPTDYEFLFTNFKV